MRPFVITFNLITKEKPFVFHEVKGFLGRKRKKNDCDLAFTFPNFALF